MKFIDEDWNYRRAKAIIDYYGFKFFFGKKILDLGAGHGEIAASFARLGADVTCVDARQDNLDFIHKKYPHLKLSKLDLDKDWPFHKNQFDIVLSLDLVCHLKNFDNHIKNICDVAEHIIIETEVLDISDNKNYLTIFEDKAVRYLSLSGEGKIANSNAIQSKLSENGASFKRIDESKLNSNHYIYDWREKNIGRKYGYRRMWIARKSRFVPHKPPPIVAELRAATPSQLQPVIPSVTQQSNADVFIPAKPVSNYFIHTAEKFERLPSKIRTFIYSNDNEFCKAQNGNNILLETIIVEPNITFNSMFQKINNITGPNDINVICSPNIIFDETIALSENINNKELYAITCFDGYVAPRFNDRCDEQNVWILRGRIPDINLPFIIGARGGDGRLAYEFYKIGYKVFNPSKSIKCYKYCNSQITNEVVPGPHLFTIPTAIF